MTLIATAISRLGIVQASDSNVTNDSDELVGEFQKVFPVGPVGGALAVAGTYTVGGRPMDEWMPAVIDEYVATAAPTLYGFAEFLRQRFAAEVNEDEQAQGTLVHLAGYVQANGDAHPEFWFVRNVDIDKSTGDYFVTERFDLSEDFWARDYLNPQVRTALAAGSEQRYFNGMLPGRVAYNVFMKRLGIFLQQAWNEPTWRFRAPRTVEELARFVDLELGAIGAMFFSSDYGAPYIGGHVQIAVVKPPPNAVTL